MGLRLGVGARDGLWAYRPRGRWLEMGYGARAWGRGLRMGYVARGRGDGLCMGLG